MREVLQVIGDIRGAVEFDQATDARANDDVQFDEPVHGRHLVAAGDYGRGGLTWQYPRG